MYMVNKATNTNQHNKVAQIRIACMQWSAMNRVFDIWDDELWSTLPARYGDGDGTQDRNDVVVQTALEDVCIELNTSPQAAEIQRLHTDIQVRSEAVSEVQTELFNCQEEIFSLQKERDELNLEVSSSYNTHSKEYVSWLSNMTIVFW